MGCAGGEEKYYHRGDFLRSGHAFFERNSGCAALEAMLTMGPRDKVAFERLDVFLRDCRALDLGNFNTEFFARPLKRLPQYR
jgi:hypothetical protein